MDIILSSAIEAILNKRTGADGLERLGVGLQMLQGVMRDIPSWVALGWVDSLLTFLMDSPSAQSLATVLRKTMHVGLLVQFLFNTPVTLMYDNFICKPQIVRITLNPSTLCIG